MVSVLSAAKWLTTSRGVAFAAALTVAIVVILLLTTGKVSAIGLDIDGLATTITQGSSDDFTLDLTIPEGELVPIENLQFAVTGPTSFTVTFDVLGNVTSSDVHITSLGLCPGEPSGGFGYGYGYLVGYENSTGFVFGYGYGYGYVSPFVTELRYCGTLDTGQTPVMPLGTYNAQFILNTGDSTKSAFSSSAASFQIVSAAPTATPTFTPLPTSTPVPLPTEGEIGQVLSDIGGLDPASVAVELEGKSPALVAAVLEAKAKENLQDAADIFSSLAPAKAGDALEAIEPGVGADLLEESDVNAAAAALAQTNPVAGAAIVDQMGTAAAANVVGAMNPADAGALVSKVSTSTGVALVGELGAAAAAPIVDNVEPVADGAIMSQVGTETLTGLIQDMAPESLPNALAQTDVAALGAVDPQVYFDALPQIPASSVAITATPGVDPTLPGAEVVQVTPTLAVYSSPLTGELTWVTLIPGSPAPLGQILGKFTRELTDVQITVEGLSIGSGGAPPAGIPGLPDGRKGIEYFRITIEGAEPEDLLAAHVTFYVLNQVLEANNFHKWSVLLHRYDDASGEWSTYDATRVREDDLRVFYTAVVPEFSLFAISGDVAPTPVRFEVSDLSVPALVVEGQEVTIQAKVTNVTEESRTFQANLFVDNVIEGTQAFAIGGGQTRTVTATVSANIDLGTHEVRLEKLIGSFTVIAGLSPDINDDGVVNVIDATILGSVFGLRSSVFRRASLDSYLLPTSIRMVSSMSRTWLFLLPTLDRGSK